MTKPTSNSLTHTQSVPIQQNSPVLDMPLDVAVEIFKHMRVRESGVCPLVCHLWNQIFGDKVVWRKLLENHFPFYRLPKEIKNFKEAYQDQCRLHLNLINGVYAEYTIDLDLEGSKISSLFISGRTLYSGDQGGKIKSWDLDTKTCVGTLDVHHRVSSFVISDRKLFCSGSSSGEIKIWDLDTKTCIGTLDGHRGEVSCLALSDGKLFSGSCDKKIKIWNLDTNSCIATLKGHEYQIYSLAVSDGKLYSGSHSDNRIYQGMVNIWDLNTETCIETIKDGLHETIYSLIISDDKLYSFFNQGLNAAINIWDLNTRKCIQVQTFDREEVKHILDSTFSHAISDGKLYSGLTLGSNAGTIKVWDFKAEHNTIFEALANQLESDNSEISDLAIQRFSRMPKRVRNKIYGELYKVLKPLELISNDYWGCGEHAFHEIKGQGSTSLQKAQAIRNYLQEQLKEDSS